MPEVILLKKKSYLAMIRNAVRGETHLFRNVFASVDGVERDILEDGKLACASFVSGILMLNGLIDRPHATVPGTEKALAAAGWSIIDEPREGAVLSWEPITYSDTRTHGHLGFYIGNERAISNASNASGIPREHHWTYDGTRNVVRIWWHPSLA
ncbi:MAG TPA: hypothetical protein VMJ72_02810 [Candidatus Paceibacterota bacterium]|nr:hypothetical protein [Candidatus Paceibacterota bacterium]